MPFPHEWISFKLDKVEWYCVTKGRIFFRAVLSLFVNHVSLSENLTSESCFTTVANGFLKSSL